jgi:predicted nucleic acid-binding protein
VTLFVDTSVWSLALRRDTVPDVAEVDVLRRALLGEEVVVTTGLVLQELMEGFAGPRDRAALLERFSALPTIAPDRDDHVDAAALRNACRRGGVQLGTIDALLAQLCIRHGLAMLTTDQDFALAARHCPLQIWQRAG